MESRDPAPRPTNLRLPARRQAGLPSPLLLFLMTLLLFLSCGPRDPGPDEVLVEFEPAVLALHRSGELRARGEELWQAMAECRLCPRECGVNRLAGEKGFCRADSTLIISSHGPHFGEERPLVGRGGSGTIFFSNCGLRCVFCINWQISHQGSGRARSIEQLADMMLELQQMGCSNINLVTPTHYLPHIMLGLDQALARGLRLPVVYNTCGYEQPEIMAMLDGMVDVYLPDFKYADSATASVHLAGAADYESFARDAFIEMQRQVGTARPDADGLIRRGLMVRHLIMPNNAARTDLVIKWLAENLPKDTYLNIMGQYIPVHRAPEYPEISRRITREEYAQALKWARDAGFTNLDVR